MCRNARINHPLATFYKTDPLIAIIYKRIRFPACFQYETGPAAATGLGERTTENGIFAKRKNRAI